MEIMPSGPTYALAQDPAYLAFLRASGLAESVATADAARRRDAINQALGIAGEDLDSQGEQTRRGISAAQEDRGVFRSGQTLQRMSEQEEDQARRRSAIELAGAGQIGDLESGLLMQLAGSQVKGAEYGLGLAGDRALSDGLSSLSLGAATPVATNTAPASVTPAATSTTPTTSLYRRKRGQQEY